MAVVVCPGRLLVRPGGLIDIKLNSVINEIADEIYFIYKHKEGADRGTDIVAVNSVRFGS